MGGVASTASKCGSWSEALGEQSGISINVQEKHPRLAARIPLLGT